MLKLQFSQVPDLKESYFLNVMYFLFKQDVGRWDITQRRISVNQWDITLGKRNSLIWWKMQRSILNINNVLFVGYVILLCDSFP